jgi:hypothetical protein
MMRKLERVLLTQDVPDEGLLRGDIGTIVLVHDGGVGYEVEFVALDGDTVAVVTLLASQVRRPQPGEIPHARALAVPATC